MICDKDGVPELIQQIRYRYSNFSFVVDLFDGRELEFGADHFCPSLDLMAYPTRMQMLEAENRIEKHIMNEYSRSKT